MCEQTVDGNVSEVVDCQTSSMAKNRIHFKVQTVIRLLNYCRTLQQHLFPVLLCVCTESTIKVTWREAKICDVRCSNKMPGNSVSKVSAGRFGA